MVHARRLSALCGLLALCSAITLKASADTFTQSGTIATDNTVVQIPFATATVQTYEFTTTSYATGGFDPVLSLFNADGTLFTGYMNNPANSASNGGSDADLIDVLGPGSYILALTEFPNYSSGTLSSFATGPATSLFIDQVTGLQTTNAYTVNYSSAGATSAVTPEPPSALLVLLPLGGFVFLNRRKLLQATAL